MTTEADIGHGTKYEVWDTTLGTPAYTLLGEVTNVDPGSDESDLIDATHMQSPGSRREFIGGLIDGGEGTIEFNFVPGNATHVLLRTYLSTRVTENHRITFPNGKRVTFPAIVRGISTPTPVDDKMVMTATVKKAGDETWDTE